LSSFSSGRQAEAAAAEYLRNKKFKILAQNWRTRWCEVDIIAQKKKTIYFVEVKYRQSDRQGSGLEYITPRKLGQMKFAATFWVAQNNWHGDYSLAAIEVSGQDFVATTFLPEL
jgi:uncharacterized protein (TIGR00252 family)